MAFLAYLAILVTVGTAIWSIVVSLFMLVFQVVMLAPTILQRLFSVLVATALAIYTFIKDHKAVILLLILIVLILFLGPYGVTDTNYFIEIYNQIVACGLAPATEAINKFFMQAFVVSGWREATPFLNNAIAFISSRSVLAYTDIVSTIRCLEATANYQYVFDLPAQASIAIASFFYAFLSAPYANKIEPFPQGEWGYYFPLENNLPALVPRYEFDPSFQAQGPAVNPSTAYPNFSFWSRSTWVGIAKLFESLVQIFVETLSDAARPTQRLLPSFYIDVAQKNSIWRKAADILTEFVELLIVQPIWPYGPGTNPEQPERDSANRYIGKFFRAVASFLSDISLIINDALTTTRPLQENAVPCEPLPGGSATLLKLFRGFPVIDFFIPGAEFNLNIFRSNLIFCRFMIYIHGQSCLGLALGSMSFRVGPPAEFCPEWTGVLSPLPEERINYLGRIVGSVKRTILIFIQEGTIENVPVVARIEQGAHIATLWLNFIIDALIFTVNSIAQIIPFDSCSITQTLTYWFEVLFPDAFIATLEFAYNDRCDVAIIEEPSKRNGFLCLIAFASRANRDTFWGTLCDTVNFIDAAVDDFGPDPNLSLHCDPGFKRKRQAGDPAPAKRKLSWYEWFRLSAPYYAYETREATSAFQYCFTNQTTSRLMAPHCNTTCAIGPCVDDALDCVVEQLGDTGNKWKQWLASTSFVRSAARASALVADAFVGCKDGDVSVLFATVNETATLMREVTARSAATWVQFSQSHEMCAERAGHSNSTVYLECLEIDPLSEVWEDTLDFHNISRSTFCGSLLRTYGIRFDDAGSSTLPHSYIGCLHMFAFGARAIANNMTREPLSSFVGEYTILDAMNKVQTEPIRNWNPEGRNTTWIDKVIAGPVVPHDGQLSDAGRESLLRGTKDGRLWKSLHSMSSIAYAYFNYQADLYKQVLMAETAGHEKDALDEAIFHNRVVSVAAALGLDMKPVVTSRTRMQQDVTAIIENRDLKPSQGIAEVAMVYGNSLLWVDRLYATAENSATSQRAQDDDLAFLHLKASDSSLVEFRIRQRFAGDPNGGRGSTYLPPMIGMRRIEDLCTTVTLTCSNSTALVVSPGEVDTFSEMELQDLITAMQVFSDVAVDHSERKNSELAVRALRNLDMQLSQANSMGEVLGRVMGRSTAKLGRVAMRVVWNLINNRLRIESLPASQTAAVLINLLTTGERGELEKWLRNENGYIVGLGYVPRDEYEVYMESEEHARLVMLSGYFSPITEEELNMVQRSWSRRFASRRRLARNVAMQATTLVDGRLALPGDTAHSRFQKRMRESLKKRIDFRHRAKFLVSHGLHIEDQHFHEIVSPDWQRYSQIKHLSAHELYQTAAQEVATNAWWIDLVDFIIFLFTRQDDVFENALLQFEGNIGDLIAGVFDDIVARFAQFWDDFFDSMACPGPGAYRLGGTLPYALGCVRFPERLFDWFTPFPRYDPPGVLPYGGIFNLYTGPGFAQWPDEMLKCNCTNERDPNMFPYPVGSFWSDPVGFWNSTNIQIVNACKDPVKANALNNCTADPTDVARPFCLSQNCDYCERSWYSAEEAGFTSWLNNVSVWSGLLTELITISVGLPAVRGFWYIVVLWILTEFTAILPIGGLLTAVFIIFSMLFGNMYIQQQPEVYAFQYFLFLFFRGFGRGIAWIAFFLYFFNLAPVVFFGASAPLFGNALIWVAQHMMPSHLLLYLTQGARAVVLFLDSFYDFIDVPATFDPAIAILSQYSTTTPTTAAALYSFFSVYNFVLVSLIIVGVVYALYLGTYVVLLPLGPVLGAFLAPFGIFFAAVLSVLIALRIIALSDSAEEQKENQEKMRRQIEELEDETDRIDGNQVRSLAPRRVKQ